MHPQRSTHNDRPEPHSGGPAKSDDQLVRALSKLEDDLEALALGAESLGSDALEYLSDLIEAEGADTAELVEAGEALKAVHRLQVEVQALRDAAAELSAG